MITAPTTVSREMHAAITCHEVNERANRLFTHMLVEWKSMVSAVWNHPDKAAVIKAMGTEAATLFKAADSLRIYLESVRPGCTLDALLYAEEYSINEDGTVSLIVPT